MNFSKLKTKMLIVRAANLLLSKISKKIFISILHHKHSQTQEK